MPTFTDNVTGESVEVSDEELPRLRVRYKAAVLKYLADHCYREGERCVVRVNDKPYLMSMADLPGLDLTIRRVLAEAVGADPGKVSLLRA